MLLRLVNHGPADYVGGHLLATDDTTIPAGTTLRWSTPRGGMVLADFGPIPEAGGPRDLSVWAQLGAGEHLSLRSEDAQTVTVPALSLEETIAHWGAPPVLAGQLAREAALHERASYIELKARWVMGQFAIDLSFTVSRRAYLFGVGSMTVTAGNTGSPMLVSELPTGLFSQLELSGATVVFPEGRLPTQLADGQMVTVRFVAWLRGAQLNQILSSLSVEAEATANYYGPLGNPALHPQSPGNRWAAENVGRVYVAETAPTLVAMPIGPAARTGTTGEQEDQFWPGAELYGDGLSGLALSRRASYRLGHPCNFREPDGSIALAKNHPGTRLWDGRPLFSISTDRLGKVSDLTLEQAGGFSGPDIEHWSLQRLFLAARLTGDTALQMRLGHQAQVYLMQRTDDPAASSSAIFGVRSLYYECLLVIGLHTNLRDRGMAADVVARFASRCRRVIIPFLSAKPGDIWDVRTDDLRLGTGEWWLPYQQAMAAFGLAHAAKCLPGLPEGLAELAARGARVVADRAFHQRQDGTWASYSACAVNGRTTDDDTFFHYGLPFVWDALPELTERDEAIRQQQLVTADTYRLQKFMPPLPPA